MLSLTVAISPDHRAAIRIPAEVELDDVLPADTTMMPVFIRGKLLELTDHERRILRSAKAWSMIFEPTTFQYDAIIDVDSWEFRAVDTSERGVSRTGFPNAS